MSTTPFKLAAFSLLVLSSHSQSADHSHAYEQHAAHVHGEAELLLAVDGNVLDMEFRSPAMNLVGFEHAPANPAQHQAVDDAMALLKQPRKLFALPAAAGCRLQGVEVTSPLAADHDHGHTHEHEAHGYEPADHGDDEHTDFTAHYHFACRDAGKLRQMGVNLFQLFPGTQAIEAQTISAHGQQATELTPAQPTLGL